MKISVQLVFEYINVINKWILFETPLMVGIIPPYN